MVLRVTDSALKAPMSRGVKAFRLGKEKSALCQNTWRGKCVLSNGLRVPVFGQAEIALRACYPLRARQISTGDTEPFGTVWRPVNGADVAWCVGHHGHKASGFFQRLFTRGSLR